MRSDTKIVMILGPTASGKTACAVQLADKIHAEIVSADSRQIYRGLDIGSGKDLAEYIRHDGSRIPAHMLDIADPAGPTYTLADYLLHANRTIDSILDRGNVPLVVGGSALYLHGLLNGYELRGGPPDLQNRQSLRSLTLPELQQKLKGIDPADTVLVAEPFNRIRLIRRIEMKSGSTEAVNEKELAPENDRKFLILGVFRTRQEIHASIERRLDERLDGGMLNEAIRLHQEGVSWETMEFFGLEYRYMALHLQGKLSPKEMRDSLLCKIRQFAKRQDSWFRKIEREGFPIYWIRPEEFCARAEPLVQTFLSGNNLPQPELRLSEIHYSK